MENRNTGIIYTKTGEGRRGKIRQYHRTQGWELWKNKSKWKTDLRGMSPSEITQTIDEVNNEYECKFSSTITTDKVMVMETQLANMSCSEDLKPIVVVELKQLLIYYPYYPKVYGEQKYLTCFTRQNTFLKMSTQ